MSLVIVESPTKAKTINKYLGSDFKVISSFGHIRDLPSKEGSVMPGQDFKMVYQINPKSSKSVKAITDNAKQTDEIILASDPDREGEAIAWHIVEMLKQKKALKQNTKIKRIVFHEITKNSVASALSNPRDINMDLVNAQQARRALDYLVGFTLSPILWHKLPGSRSAGRVQSVALRLICEREDEIERFKSEEYWSIDCELATGKKENFLARLTHINGKKLEKLELKDKKAVEPIISDLNEGGYRVISVEKKTKQRNPYPPFITSTLQQEAVRKLGFSAKKTMTLAQKLYEGVELGGEVVGLITYMRTDGTQLSSNSVEEARTFIEKLFGKNYLPEKPRSYKTKVKNAQEAHEAIRPTDINNEPAKIKQFLDKDQYKLYELIWKRMVACQMSNAILDQVSADIKHQSNKYILRASGSTVKFDGFLKLYKEDKDDEAEEENRMLPPLQKDDPLALIEVKPEQHFTQPPPRYTEASLVKKLEELGIGRPSTYAAIISVLQDRNYVKLDQRRFVPEERGMVVTAFLKSFFKKYVEYDFTASLEDELDLISDGKLQWKELLKKFWEDFKKTVDETNKQPTKEVLDKIEEVLDYHIFQQNDLSRKCPACKDGELELKMGKFGPFVACSNYPECHYTRELEVQETDAESSTNLNEKVICTDSNTDRNIYLKHGPYGHYLQLGEDNEKDHKRSPVPKFIKLEQIDSTLAEKIINLPRKLGTHPETGKDVVAGIGRYGPYILHDKKFTSIKNQAEVFTITLEEALELMKQSGNKILGKHDGKDVELCKGRYGLYIKYNKANYRIPKNIEPETITLQQAEDIISKSKK